MNIIDNSDRKRKKQKDKESPEFHLSQSALPAIQKIIIGYTRIQGSADYREVAASMGEHYKNVTLSHSFLVDLGLLEGATKKSITPLGRELGMALINGTESDVILCTRKVIDNNDFCLKLLSDMKQRGKFTRGDFQKRIFYHAKYFNPTKDIRVGANALINLLVETGYVDKSGSHYYISSAYNEVEINKHHVRKDNLFIAEEHIFELEKIKNQKFDLSRLIKYCKEINENFENENYSSVIFLCRALLDHCPPIFGYPNLESLCEQLPPKNSLKKVAVHLNASLKKIADHHIHKQIGAREILPTLGEIDFKNDMNFLIGRIIESLAKSEL